MAIRFVLLSLATFAAVAMAASPSASSSSGGSMVPPASGSGSGGGSAAPASTATTTTCCKDKSCEALYQTTSNTTRTMLATGCPGYDYSSQTTGNPTYVQCTALSVNIKPVIRTTPQYVGTSNPVLGALGVAINGVAIYGPTDAQGRDAVVYEGVSMDHCFGHSDQTGEYHYHTAPTAGCVYNDTVGAHSPLFGFMADGIPIYGKQDVGGVAPTNLDTCGGHVGVVPSGGTVYHYHAQSAYPYLVNCLVGCVQPGQAHSLATDCTAAATQYDYSSLANAYPTAPSNYLCATAAGNAPSALQSGGVRSFSNNNAFAVMIMAMMVTIVITISAL